MGTDGVAGGYFMTRTIAFLNQKGGVGKTTTTVNIAAALAKAGRRIGVIDLDPQAHLTLHLGMEVEENQRSVYDVLVDDDIPVEDAMVEVKPNLFILPAEVDLAAAETELAADERRNDRLRQKLLNSDLADSLDFILIDCPPSLGLLTLNALAASREVIVPMQAHFLALQGVGKLLETVGLVCRQVNPALQVTGVVLCMYEGQTKLAGEVVADLEAFFAEWQDRDVPWRNCRVLRPPIRRNIKLAESPSFGEAIFDYDPRCPGAKDYGALAKGLLKEWDALLDRRGVKPKGAAGASNPPVVEVPAANAKTRNAS